MGLNERRLLSRYGEVRTMWQVRLGDHFASKSVACRSSYFRRDSLLQVHTSQSHGHLTRGGSATLRSRIAQSA